MPSFKILLIVGTFIGVGLGQNIFSKAKQNPKCKKIPPTKNLDMDWAMQLFVGARFFVPMGSQVAYEDFSELLGGKRATDAEGINKMCVEVRLKGFKSTVEAYDGRYMIVDCALISKGVQECTANSRTEFPERHQAVKAIQTLAWTDNKDSVIIVRCSPKGDKNDWVLYSKNTTVSEVTKKKVLAQLEKMGFSSSTMPIHYADYSGCSISPNSEED